MQDYKILLGYVGTGVALVSYTPYVWNTIRGTTKPHAFSWFVWGVLTGIAFLAQLTSDAGSGSWVTGLTAAICFVVVALALAKGDRHFTAIDWISFITALVAIILWKLTDNPVLAVVLVTLGDALGFVPTYRKGYNKPHEETAIQFALASVKWMLGIAALASFSVTTVLYPAALIFLNGGCAILLFLRRKQLSSPVHTHA